MLERLQTEVSSDPARLPQVAAVRFYLQALIWEYEREWEAVHKGITNHVTLLDQLRRCRTPGQPTLLVTFNYDKLIEAALPSVQVPISDIANYVLADSFKLIKLHGSVNWARLVVAPEINTKGNAHEVARTLIRRFGELTISQEYRLVDSYPSTALGDCPAVPAIAIPVETKTTFECPPEHLRQLEEHLGEVMKILIVGWRGAEMHFLKLLRDHLRSEVEVMVVAENASAAGATFDRMHAAGIRGKVQTVGGGFSDFTISRRAEEFFGVG